MSDLNPYAAPKVDEAPVLAPEEALELRYASMGTRFLNYLIDLVVRLILWIPLGILMAGLGFDFDDRLSRILFDKLLELVYYLFMEGLFGVTIGKLITGTRIVDDEGKRPSFGQIVGRSFARLVPFEPFSFFSNPSVGWHDSWSNTRVIKVRR